MFGRLCIILLSVMVYFQGSAISFAHIPITLTPYDIIDKTTLKQREMRDTIVSVQTVHGSGSGTIIDRIDTDDEDIFEYRVLTNAHVISSRFITHLRGVDFLTGRTKTEVIDMGCWIITFDHLDKSWDNHTAKIILEDTIYDLAVLSFVSEKKLTIAKQANSDQLQQIRVFDEVFAIGCQLGLAPFPTFGIIAQILGGNNNQKWIVYANTAQVTPGSSGGALFREFDGHYYLIGIPYSVAVIYNGQIIPHMAYAISLTTASELIDSSCVSK